MVAVAVKPNGNWFIVCYSIYNWIVLGCVKKASSKMFEVSIAAYESFQVFHFLI